MTAAESDKSYTTVCLRELQEAGCGDIRQREMDHQFLPNEFSDLDAIYVAGGNTFLLMQKMRECGFKNALIPFLDRGGLYVGVSAGSIVVGPSIEIAGPWDPNEVGLTDLTGLEIVDFAVTPHYDKKDQTIINELQKKASYEIVPLTDQQAMFIDGGKRTLIE